MADNDPRVVCIMVSDAADFLCGSVVFVDSGTDAYLRADDWPKAVPDTDCPVICAGSRAFAKRVDL